MPSRPARRVRWRPPAVLLDAAVAVLTVAALWIPAGGMHYAERPALLLLPLIAIVGTLLRRRWPRWAIALALGASLGATGLGLSADPGVLAAYALYPLAQTRARRVFPPAAAVAIGLSLLGVLLLSAGPGAERARDVLLASLALSASWALGACLRAELERSRSDASAAERARLARDVHDVLSQSLGTIGVRAGVAAHVTTLDDAALRGELRAIEESARTATHQLRELLSAVRADDDIPPAPLDARLAEAARLGSDAGLPTSLTLSAPLPDSAVLHSTIDRVAREAVVNAVRHARATACAITVTSDDDAVVLRVHNDGAVAATAEEGHGLRGCRERVALLGGSFTAGPGEAGGWDVLARIPHRRTA